jgi:DNA repair photolyase
MKIGTRYLPRTIFVEKGAEHAPLVRRILKNCRDIPRRTVSGRRELEERLAGGGDPVGEGKHVLYLARQNGSFVKPCPCTPGYVGCSYFIVNSVLNCPLDCTYCILQLYLGGGPLTVFSNLERLWTELDRLLAKTRGRAIRIGTGELSDSLALDHLTGASGEMVSYFRKRPGALFELKTKTAAIEGLLRAAPAENIVVSWSLNPPAVVRQDESGAAPVRLRLEAAGQAARRGYPVGFHFDPLILFRGWEEAYGRLVNALFRAVPAGRIRWISLGSLRFPPALKGIIERRFPHSRLVHEELVPGKDGKLRYFKPLRLELYRKVAAMIRDSGGENVPLYFCMEDPEVWERVLKWRPKRKAEVELSLSPRSVGSKSIL